MPPLPGACRGSSALQPTSLGAFYAQSLCPRCCKPVASFVLLNSVAHALVKMCMKDSLVAVYRKAIDTVVHVNVSLVTPLEDDTSGIMFLFFFFFHSISNMSNVHCWRHQILTCCQKQLLCHISVAARSHMWQLDFCWWFKQIRMEQIISIKRHSITFLMTPCS